MNNFACSMDYVHPVYTLNYFMFITAATIEQNFGKVNITESSPDGFYCETVSYATPFQNGGTIRVFPSLSHEDHPGNGNEASVAVVTSVNQNSFALCLMEPARPTGEMTLNWFAFSDAILPQGVRTGSISYSVFTSGSSCNDITFSRVSFHTQHVQRLPAFTKYLRRFQFFNQLS